MRGEVKGEHFRVHDPDRLAVEEGQRVFYALGIKRPHRLGDDIAEMRRQHRIRRATNDIAGRERFSIEDVEPREDAAVPQSRDQRVFVDERASRSVDEDRSGFHSCDLRRADRPPASRRKHQVQTDRIGAAEQFILPDPLGANRGGDLRREVLAPRDDVHAERTAISSHDRAEPAEPDDAQRLPRERDPDGRVLLEAAGADGGVAGRDRARDRQQETERQLRGRRLAREGPGRIADDDAAGGAGVAVEAFVAAWAKVMELDRFDLL